MSKAALVGLAKGLAHDLGQRGITINNIQSGPWGGYGIASPVVVGRSP
jgi:NAD(P)-dependent dehydrogenase (short-subunit alcohol dehydrogenase family)